MYEELYKNISQASCSILVTLGGEVISEGSGFAISKDGAVFTAAHVITGRMPIQERDYKDPDINIFVKFPRIPVIEYSVVICSINISVAAFTEKVQIDQALIVPKTAVQLPFEPFTIASPPKLGEEVFFAGYSDELQLPFRLDRIIRPDAKDLTFGADIRREQRSDMTGPMIKRGVVGNVLRMQTSEAATNISLECDVFYIDNGIHSGASGGPIVNRRGQAIGVIVQRAVTSAAQSSDPNLAVPSGATVGLSCVHTIPAMYRHVGGTRIAM